MSTNMVMVVIEDHEMGMGITEKGAVDDSSDHSKKTDWTDMCNNAPTPTRSKQEIQIDVNQCFQSEKNQVKRVIKTKKNITKYQVQYRYPTK